MRVYVGVGAWVWVKAAVARPRNMKATVRTYAPVCLSYLNAYGLGGLTTA